MHALSDKLMHLQLIFLVQVRLRTEGLPRTPSSTLPGLRTHDLPDHDRTVHVTETPTDIA